MIFNSVIGNENSAISILPKDVNFYDYDGTLVYSYELADAQALTVLPNGPTHDGLVFQGWNWPLEKIKALTRPMNIGATYITADGKTRFKIRIKDKTISNFTLYISQTLSNGASIDWGDKSGVETIEGVGDVSISHEYAEIGEYIISIEVSDGCTLKLYCTEDASILESSNAYRDLLQEVNIGARVTHINSYSFDTCRYLSRVTIPNCVVGIGSNAFSTCVSLSGITIPDSVKIISSHTFDNCHSLSNVAIPDSITVVDLYAFHNCFALSTITIPDSVEIIGNFSFRSCSSLSKVVLSDALTSISEYAFSDCASLSSVTIPDGITRIAAFSFTDCVSLPSVTISASVTSIGRRAFRGNKGTAEYHMKSSTPPTLEDADAFSSVRSFCVIYVPVGSLEAYKAANNWSAYADYIREEL